MLAIGITVSADPAPKPAAVKPGGKPAPVGKPFQRVAYRRAVDDAGADAADRGADIEQEEAYRPSS